MVASPSAPLTIATVRRVSPLIGVNRRGQSGVEQLLGDDLASHPADEAQCEHLVPERRGNPSDVDALATGALPDVGDAVTAADHEFVDPVRDVERQVQCDGSYQSSHEPARITFWTAYSSSRTTRSARLPVSIPPIVYQPNASAGVVEAIRDASTSETPAFTALR